MKTLLIFLLKKFFGAHLTKKKQAIALTVIVLILAILSYLGVISEEYSKEIYATAAAVLGMNLYITTDNNDKELTTK